MLKTFKKLRQLKVVSPFRCKEIFHSLSDLIDALPKLEVLSVDFIGYNNLWKNWVNPLTADFDIVPSELLLGECEALFTVKTDQAIQDFTQMPVTIFTAFRESL